MCDQPPSPPEQKHQVSEAAAATAANRKRHHFVDPNSGGQGNYANSHSTSSSGNSSNSQTTMPPLSQPGLVGHLCAVCGDHTSEPAGTFGGSATACCCDSCKAFFRRNGGRRHDCSREGNCEVTVATRKHCRACRYRRCLEAGLRQSSPPPMPPQQHQLPPPPPLLHHQQPQEQHSLLYPPLPQPPPDKKSRSSSLDESGAYSVGEPSGSGEGGGHESNGDQDTGSSCVGGGGSLCDTDIPTQPVANWRDALLKVANYYGEDRTQLEADLIANLGNTLGDCINVDMTVPFAVNHDLSRGLAEQLNDWREMITQLEIFIQPAIRFCKSFLASPFFKDMPGWRPEHSVLLVKQRIHSILVPIFSTKFDTSRRMLSVTIAGKDYPVDPNKSIRDLDRSFMPGLSAVTSNDRYFEYVHKVTESDPALIGLFTLLKLFDLSLSDKEDLLEDMEGLAFDMFMRLAKCARHAFVARFNDRWLPKLRELCILFEWSKTFELSLSALFNSISSQSPTPLFAEIYT